MSQERWHRQHSGGHGGRISSSRTGRATQLVQGQPGTKQYILLSDKNENKLERKRGEREREIGGDSEGFLGHDKQLEFY